MKKNYRRWAAFAMVLAALVAAVGLAPKAALAAEGDVAKIGDTSYATLADAEGVARAGDTITLLDSTETTPVTFDQGVTLDLGGNTLSIVAGEGSSSVGLTFTKGANKICNGTIVDTRSADNKLCGFIAVRVIGSGVSLETDALAVQTYVPNTTDNYNYILRVEDGASLTLNSGTKVTEINKDNLVAGGADTWGTAGVAVLGSAETTDTTDTKVDEATATKLTVNDGVTISTSSFAIAGNGSNSNNTIITINGGEMTSSYAQGIYHPQYGSLVVNGGTITGQSGIEMRSGELEVNGGTIVGTGTPVEVKPNGNGSTSAGAGIAIAQHTTKLPIKVAVNDGTISGFSAVYEDTPENEPRPDVIELSITGGTFKVTNGGKNALYSKNVTKFVTGGTFEGNVPAEYIPEGFAPVETENGFTVADDEDILTVTFVDGEDKATVEVLSGSTVASQPITAVAGYEPYWALNGAEYDFDTPVTADITLTAAQRLLPPELTIESDNPVVTGNKATITVKAESDAKVTYTYKWYGNGQALSETSDTLTASAQGEYYVVVTATDADGLTAEAQSNTTYVYFYGTVMYRLYNPYNGEHLYTANTLERDFLDSIGWNYEGIGWIAPQGSNTPVYRLNNPFSALGDHHYTTSIEEYETLQELGWKGEGVAWYSADKETGVPVLRQYNPFASSGTHNYTVSEEERDNLVSLGWKDEGVGWYALDTEAK